MDNHEYIDSSLTNFLLHYIIPGRRDMLFNIMDILNSVNKYTPLETELFDIITTSEEDDCYIIDKFNISVINYLDDILKTYGVTLYVEDIVFKYHYYILNTFKELFTYNDINTNIAINILNSLDNNDDILKLAQLVNLYNNVNIDDIYEVIDDLGSNVIIDIDKGLNEVLVRQEELNAEDITTITNIELTDTYMYKVIHDNNDLPNVTYESYLSVLLDFITIEDISISDIAKNIYVVVKLDNKIDDKRYFVAKQVEDDLLELNLTLDDVNDIVGKVNEWIYKGERV